MKNKLRNYAFINFILIYLPALYKILDRAKWVDRKLTFDFKLLSLHYLIMCKFSLKYQEWKNGKIKDIISNHTQQNWTFLFIHCTILWTMNPKRYFSGLYTYNNGEVCKFSYSYHLILLSSYQITVSDQSCVEELKGWLQIVELTLVQRKTSVLKNKGKNAKNCGFYNAQ